MFSSPVRSTQGSSSRSPSRARASPSRYTEMESDRSPVTRAVTAKEMESTLRFYEAAPEDRDYSFIGALQRRDMSGACTYCGHCMPCPAGIVIPSVNRYYDLAKVGDPLAWGHYANLSVHADACTGCGRCAKECPFHVDMPVRMAAISQYFKGSSL